MYMILCVCVYTPCAYRSQWRPEEGVGSPGAGVAGGCELPGVGAGKRTAGFLQGQQYL